MMFKKRGAVVWAIGIWLGGVAASAQSLPNLYPFPNASGVLETYNAGVVPSISAGRFSNLWVPMGAVAGPVTSRRKVGESRRPK
jgi:hypothetical protein